MPTRAQVLSTLKSINADDKVWVAGSAAIYPELASDIDIWILPKSHLKATDFAPEMWTDITSTHDYPNLTIACSKRLELVVPEGIWGPALKVQVMFPQVKQIWELLDQFDVSCHAWARNKDGYLIAHPDATLPGSPIKWINEPPDMDIKDPYYEDDFGNFEMFETQVCTKGTCEICDGQNWPHIDAGDWHLITPATLVKPVNRLERFTARYANTTRDLLWLPA